MTQHWSSISEGSLVQPPSRGSTQNKQRGYCHFNPLVYANSSDNIVHTECGQLLPKFLREDISRVVQIPRKPAFGSLYDGSCLVRMTPIKLFEVESFPTETNYPVYGDRMLGSTTQHRYTFQCFYCITAMITHGNKCYLILFLLINGSTQLPQVASSLTGLHEPAV